MIIDRGTEQMDRTQPEYGDRRERISLKEYYGIGAIATTIGISVVIILNLSTPLDFFQNIHLGMTHEKSGLFGSGFYGIIFQRLAAVLLLSYILTLLSIRMMLRPISNYVKVRKMGQTPVTDVLERAQRRLLNLPYIFIPVNVGFWIFLPAIIFITAYFTGKLSPRTALILSVRTSMVGLIASAIASHRIESHSRRRLIPHFFPHGQLCDVKGAARISISRRINLLYRLGSVIPIIILLVTLITLQIDVDSAAISAKDYGEGILFFTLILSVYFFVSSGILNRAVSRSITQPLEEIMTVLRRIHHGNFDEKVRVLSNDEIGYTGDIINEMTEGLKERDRMRHSLELAMQVQQNLLPKRDPVVDGLDISGKSVYCDETGGDYYDFIDSGKPETGRIGIVLGDVSGHGISSALLMATSRAFLRQRASLPGSISDVVSDVNKQLSSDVGDSGSFVTMFYMTIDVHRRCLNWVRAGHEPAIFYDPRTDSFEELKGFGVALGIDEDFSFTENEKLKLEKDQIIVLCTDGIFEAQNMKGDLFGKKSVFDIIRTHASLSANEILSALLDSLGQFQAGKDFEDDVTLIVVKMT